MGNPRTSSFRLRRLFVPLVTAAVLTGCASLFFIFEPLRDLCERGNDVVLRLRGYGGPMHAPKVKLVIVDQAVLGFRSSPATKMDRVIDLARVLVDGGAEATAYLGHEPVIMTAEEREKLGDTIGDLPFVVVESSSWFPTGEVDGVITTDRSGVPVPLIESAAQAFPTEDLFGVARRVPLVLAPPDSTDPTSIHVAARLLALSENDSELEIAEDHIALGDRRIPTEERHTLRVNYSTVYFEELHASALLAKAKTGAASRPFDGWMVILETDRADFFGGTPVGQMSLGQVTAQALNTMVEERYLYVEPLWHTLIAVFVVSGIVALVARTRGGWAALAVAAVLTAANLYRAWDRSEDDVLINVALPSFAVAVSTVAGASVRSRRERRLRKELESILRQHVPDSVLDELLAHEPERVAAGARVQATVLFCDLRSFTPIAASLTPGEVKNLLDSFYRHASKIVLDHSGTLVQYVGDEVMVVFGAPLPVSDHAARAVAAAEALLAETGSLNEDLAAQSLPAVSYGIGVHSGEVVTAVVGTDAKRQYAVIGDAVNVGSRLTTAAEGGQILLSGDLLDHLAEKPEIAPVEGLHLKGISRSLDVYRLGSDRPEG